MDFGSYLKIGTMAFSIALGLAGGITMAVGASQACQYKNELDACYNSIPESTYADRLESLNNEFESGKITSSEYEERLHEIKKSAAEEFYSTNGDGYLKQLEEKYQRASTVKEIGLGLAIGGPCLCLLMGFTL